MTRVGPLFVSLLGFHVKLSSQCPSSTHPPQKIWDTLPEANTALRRPWRSRAMSVPRHGHHSRPTFSIATLMSSKASQNNQWNSSTLHPALLKGQRYTSPWNSWTNAFHSYWAPKTKTWYCPHKLCIRAYQTHVRLHLTDVNFEYAIHCSFNKKNRVYQDLWFRICVPTCFSPQLYMVQSAWAWASSVMSAPPPMVLGRDRNSRAEATLFFIKSITWTSLKLHVISLFLAQVELGTVLHQENAWIGEHIVDRLPFWGDITWCHCNLARLCDILLHIIIIFSIFLPLASIICFGFLSCIFGKN